MLRRILGTSPIESFSAVITIAIGQSEIAVALRPFLPLLTGAELFAVMASGASSTAGSILAGYAALGVPMTYLLAASVMAIPGGLLYAKILMPSVEPTRIATTRVEFGEIRAANIIEAAADGTQKGLAVAVSVGAMLIAFVGLIALANGIVGYVGGLAGYPRPRSRACSAGRSRRSPGCSACPGRTRRWSAARSARRSPSTSSSPTPTCRRP